MKIAHALGPGAEFDVVRALVARWGDVARGIGDDAAVLDLPRGTRLVASTDSSVENAHFRRAWLTAEEIGYRATASAFSDLAAMAARPLAALVALVVPDRWRAEVPALADGIGAAARDADAHVVGGDLSRGEQLALTITVLGAAVAPVGRGGAHVGDGVYVTGRLGAPLRALQAFERGAAPSPDDRARFARPTARVREGAWLGARGATAMLDVSDGLAADLRHLAAASGVRVVLDPARVPRVDGASIEEALASGEEYELAVTLPASAEGDETIAAFARTFELPLTRVGRVEACRAGETPTVATAASGATVRVDLPPGHDHFSQ